MYLYVNEIACKSNNYFSEKILLVYLYVCGSEVTDVNWLASLQQQKFTKSFYIVNIIFFK